MLKLKIAKIFFIALIALGFWHITSKNFDPDLGWHLRVGEQISTTGEIPRHDPFSHTMPGFEWVNHEWLVDGWLWWMQSHNLWRMVTAIFTALAFLPFLVWIIRAERLSWLWVIFLGALSLTPFIGVRPQMISFFLFFVVFEMFRSPKSKQWIWAVLPVIFFIWANLHGGFVAGLVLFASFLIARKFPKIALTSFAASILASLINPYGWKLYGEIFTVFLSSDTTKYVQEWLSIASSGNIPILIFLAVFLALFINYWRQYPATVILPTAIFLIMGVKSMRNFPLFLIVALPFIFSAIELLRQNAIKSQELAPLSARTWLILRFCVIALFAAVIGYSGYLFWHRKSGGYPEKAVSFMEQKIKNGEWDNVALLNEYGWGGYLIWRLPEVKVFIDGRMPHWQDANGNSAMKDYVTITKLGDIAKKEKILEKRKINTIISTSAIGQKIGGSGARDNQTASIIRKINDFFYGEGNVNLKDELLKNGWKVEYEDNTAIILRK